MRKMLNVSNKLVIPLSEELELISLYLQLEQLRLQNQFNFSVINHCLENSNTLKCPAMITQVFVENAVWHGVAPKESTGNIKIEVYQESNYYIISIEDDGVGFNQNSIRQKDYSSWGTSIIEDKVRLIHETFHINISLNVTSTPGKGTTVQLKIPII
jgi:LytS/YehU family sensor histidine kinase